MTSECREFILIMTTFFYSLRERVAANFTINENILMYPSESHTIPPKTIIFRNTIAVKKYCHWKNYIKMYREFILTTTFFYFLRGRNHHHHHHHFSVDNGDEAKKKKNANFCSKFRWKDHGLSGVECSSVPSRRL